MMEMTGYVRSLLKTIKDNCNFWLINRADGLEKQILGVKICGTKSRRWQRTKYTDSLNDYLTRKESPNSELISSSDHREDSKAMITDVCNRPDT